MGKVTAFSIPGVTLLFYSHDHAPPHFHARSSAWEIRVFIETTTDAELHWTTKWPPNPTISRSTLRTLRTQTVQHRVALLQEWEQKVAR